MSNIQREIHAELSDIHQAGYWRIIAKPHAAAVKDVTMLRGVPIQIGDFSDADPFGPQAMSLVLPQVSIFDALGFGELDWLRKSVDIDVLWLGELPAGYPAKSWSWPG